MTDTPADLDAVRSSYDAVADNYVELGVGRLAAQPWLRAALSAFAEQVRDVGPALDAGCGPGDASGYLHGLGVDVSGLDLSPAMVAHARRRFPDIPFRAGSVTDVQPEPESLGGVLGWWSWFNLPFDILPQVLATMARALRVGGQLLVGTHCGAGSVVRTRGYGDVPVRWTTHLYAPEDLADMITAAGLQVVVELRFPSTATQPRPQVVIAAQKPSP